VRWIDEVLEVALQRMPEVASEQKKTADTTSKEKAHSKEKGAIRPH